MITVLPVILAPARDALCPGDNIKTDLTLSHFSHIFLQLKLGLQ